MKRLALFVLSLLTAAHTAAASDTPAMPEFRGACDASAAITLPGGALLVAVDEDNLVRAYQPGNPTALFQMDLSRFLDGAAQREESDIEAVAVIGDTSYWITSHGADKKGLRAPARHRLFAMRTLQRDGRLGIVPIGKPYSTLLEDLSAHPALERFAIAEAATRAPKTEGALNVEAMAATPEGTLLIGFRNPVAEGKALIVPLLNPAAVIQGEARAQLGAPIQLNLGGNGLRSMEFDPTSGSYLLIAGPIDEGGTLSVYRWSGRDGEAPRAVNGLAFDNFQPEALVAGSEGTWFLLSDDGTRLVDGRECKDAAIAQRSFRYLEVRIRSAEETAP